MSSFSDNRQPAATAWIAPPVDAGVDVLPIVRIEPGKRWAALQLGELWECRELLYFLTWRDVKVRYKQTILGAAWAILQPVLTMVVFSLFFGRLAKIPSDGVPYPVFTYAALVPWVLFSNGLNHSANSLVNSAHLIRKVYLPRLMIPLATVLSELVDFCLAFLVLVAMLVYYDLNPTLNWLWLPLLMVLALVTSVGAGLWLSALNVQFRDVRYALPFIVQFWMFATPIAYPSSLLPEPWRTLYGLNPMVGVVEGFRWSLLGISPAPGPILLASTLAALALLATGALYFRRMDRTFADLV